MLAVVPQVQMSRQLEMTIRHHNLLRRRGPLARPERGWSYRCAEVAARGGKIPVRGLAAPSHAPSILMTGPARNNRQKVRARWPPRHRARAGRPPDWTWPVPLASGAWPIRLSKCALTCHKAVEHARAPAADLGDLAGRADLAQRPWLEPAPVVQGEIPVAVRTARALGPGPAQCDGLHARQLRETAADVPDERMPGG